MKTLKIIIYILAMLIAIILIVPIFLPANYQVERSTVIDAPVSKTFMAAADYSLRNKWDPWILMDPEATVVVNQAPDIIGTYYTWEGNIIGKGKLTIQNIEVNKKVESKIEFIEPREMVSDIFWTFEEKGDSTLIRWGFKGELSYPFEKWAGLFMDKQLGTSFEKGLSNFKNLVESMPDAEASTSEIVPGTIEEQHSITMTRKIKTHEIQNVLGEIFKILMSSLQENNLIMDGMPFAIYHDFDVEGTVQLEAGFPIRNKIDLEGDISYKKIAKQKAVKAIHYGDYNKINMSYTAIQDYIKRNNMVPASDPMEIYATNPSQAKHVSKWKTIIFFPIKEL